MPSIDDEDAQILSDVTDLLKLLADSNGVVPCVGDAQIKDNVCQYPIWRNKVVIRTMRHFYDCYLAFQFIDFNVLVKHIERRPITSALDELKLTDEAYSALCRAIHEVCGEWELYRFKSIAIARKGDTLRLLQSPGAFLAELCMADGVKIFKSAFGDGIALLMEDMFNED